MSPLTTIRAMYGTYCALLPRSGDGIPRYRGLQPVCALDEDGVLNL
jgi:hypothetical protein